ncbi:uncharacterized protein [Spinacia oleracea]|uniref:Retrotransposon gag domain-containing protein n=1 Tax=Spinacia oleracea TaxID=3562 RepID=A0A9R0I8G4_SPIOL|nr:uncharacterized protein LOC110784411 [Spinacia oleracea]
MPDTKTTFHPALAVSNIKNHVSVTFEMGNVQYGTWAELFKVHARSHRVLHHIIAPVKEAADKTTEDDDMWVTLDATVLGWIFSTISNDLLTTITEPDMTAMEAWERLESIFHDQANSRAVTLEQVLTHTRMQDFPNASAYCLRLKMLADQLKNVGAPVSNNRLVLQMVAGLTEAYKHVGTNIHQSKVLPSFYEVRSSLCLEEKGLAAMYTTGGGGSAMVTDSDDASDGSGHRNPTHHRGGNNRNNGGKKHGHKSGDGSKSDGSHSSGGKNRGGGNGHGGQQQSVQQGQASWLDQSPWGWFPPLALPPCPYPT